MDGKWVQPLNGRNWKYYRKINGKQTMVISCLHGDYYTQYPTSIILIVHDSALIYNGDYTLGDAEQFYKIACSADNDKSAHRAIMAYMKMRGMLE